MRVTSQLAQEVSRITLIGFPFLFLYELIRKLLQANSILKPQLYMSIISNVVIVVGRTSLGFHGAAIAHMLSGLIVRAISTLPC